MEPEPEMIKYQPTCINATLVLPQFESLCEELICAICLGIVWDPISCAKCTTPYGTKCLENWFKRDSRCPKGCTFEKREIAALSKRMMNKIQFYCLNKTSGCNQIVTYENFYDHVNSCQFASYKYLLRILCIFAIWRRVRFF